MIIISKNYSLPKTGSFLLACQWSQINCGLFKSPNWGNKRGKELSPDKNQVKHSSLGRASAAHCYSVGGTSLSKALKTNVSNPIPSLQRECEALQALRDQAWLGMTSHRWFFTVIQEQQFWPEHLITIWFLGASWLWMFAHTQSQEAAQPLKQPQWCSPARYW